MPRHVPWEASASGCSRACRHWNLASVTLGEVILGFWSADRRPAWACESRADVLWGCGFGCLPRRILTVLIPDPIRRQNPGYRAAQTGVLIALAGADAAGSAAAASEVSPGRHHIAARNTRSAAMVEPAANLTACATHWQGYRDPAGAVGR